MPFFKRKEEPQFFDVQEISADVVSKLPVVLEEPGLKLCKDKGCHQAILKCPDEENKCFSLFRIVPESDARTMFARFNNKLALNLDVFGKECMNLECLQKLTNAIRFHEDYTLAHLATCAGVLSLFKKEAVRSLINQSCEETKQTPLFLAVEEENVELIKVLLDAGANVDRVDIKGDSLFHCAARCKCCEIIKILGAKDKSKVNSLNKSGFSPLHEACTRDLPDNVRELLALGADPCTTDQHIFPIHFALKNDSLRGVEMLCKSKKCQANRVDTDLQDTPLHWAKSKEALCLLLRLGAELEKKNAKGETALMKKVKEASLSEVITCLYKGADINTTDNDTNTPLIVAIMNDNFQLVKLLLAFGADVNLCCTDRDVSMTPRHRAAVSNIKNKDAILYFLNAAGAERCSPETKDCNSGCSFKGTNNGKAPKADHCHPSVDDDLTMDAVRALWNSCDNEVLKKAEERCSSVEVETEEIGKKANPGLKILAINSGRLEGLGMIKALMCLEKVCGKCPKECFDLIGGSGSGAFIALAIMQDKPLKDIFNIYLELCQELLFNPECPCNEKEFDARLKSIFGETKKMSDCPGVKVATTACRCDDRPLKKVMCRNYEIPGASTSSKRKVDPYMKPADVCCWRAAKWSGFADAGLASSSKTFLDGCLLGNDPTLDLLLEVQQCNAAAIKSGGVAKPVHLVVSLGGECSLAEMDESLKVEGREKLKEKEEKELLGKLLLEYSQHTDNHSAMQARAWCHSLSVPIFRFHPCTPSMHKAQEAMRDPLCLSGLLWDNYVYLREQNSKFKKIASLIC